MGRDGRSPTYRATLEKLSWDDLPPPNTTRWVPRKKAAVVAAVDNGLLSLHEAMSRYSLSLEEFVSWQHAISSHGLMGLRANAHKSGDRAPLPIVAAQATSSKPDMHAH